MILMITQWTPYHKTDEWFKIFQEIRGSIPSFIKRWHSYAVPDEDRGIKGYNLIIIEKGNADKALIEISQLLAPFWRIEGFSMKIEPIFGIRDALKVLGKSV